MYKINETWDSISVYKGCRVIAFLQQMLMGIYRTDLNPNYANNLLDYYKYFFTKEEKQKEILLLVLPQMVVDEETTRFICSFFVDENKVKARVEDMKLDAIFKKMCEDFINFCLESKELKNFFLV
jgi:hypothetical protein